MLKTTTKEKRLGATIVIVVVIAIGSSLAVAGEPARPSSASSQGYSTVPFNLGEQRIAPGFRGNDPQLLFKILSKSASDQKTEFETSAEFENRVAANLKKPLYGKLFRDSLFSFVCDRNEVQTSYVGSPTTMDSLV